MQCDKCLAVLPEGNFVEYAVPNFGEIDNVCLCHQCNCIYDNRNFMLIEFLKEDFGQFPIDKIDKRMIEARRFRSQGKGPWPINRDQCNA